MRIIQETQKFNPIEVKVLVETQEEYNNLLEYVKNQETKVVSSGREPDSEGWISNIGNDTERWPCGYGVTKDTKIEIRRRNLVHEKQCAGFWDISWCETDGSKWSIIEFRVLKD